MTRFTAGLLHYFNAPADIGNAPNHPLALQRGNNVMDAGRGTHSEFLPNLSNGGRLLMGFKILPDVIQDAPLSSGNRHDYLLLFGEGARTLSNTAEHLSTGFFRHGRKIGQKTFV